MVITFNVTISKLIILDSTINVNSVTYRKNLKK